MPHPRKHLKLTGDTHPPELDYGFDDEVDEEEDREGDEPAPRLQPPRAGAIRRIRRAPAGATLQHPAARPQQRAGSRPWLILGAAAALGFVLYRALR